MYAPTFYHTPGSLSLKSNMPMDYSRGVMSNKWQIKREGEPKTNELWSGDKPSLHQATYSIVSQQVPNTVKHFLVYLAVCLLKRVNYDLNRKWIIYPKQLQVNKLCLTE